MSDTQLDEIRAYFQRQLDNYQRRNVQSVYAVFAEHSVTDDDILKLLVGAVSKSYNYLLFSIVHYLLLRGADHELREYFPSLTPNPRNRLEVYPIFRDFCLQHAEEINDLARKRQVQYTSLWRASSLVLGFSVIDRKLNDEPIAMLDIGTGAGFLMLWDKFAYDYGIHRIDTPDAALHLNCEVGGVLRPPFPQTMPQIIARKGVDIAPIDLNNDADRLWLQASVPPDEHEHAQHIKQGIQALQRYQPEIVAGDGSHDIAHHAATLAPDSPICIVDTYVSNIRTEILQQCRELGKTRPVFQITMGRFPEGIGLRLIDHSNTPDEEAVIFKTDVPGQYIEWLDETTADGTL